MSCCFTCGPLTKGKLSMVVDMFSSFYWRCSGEEGSDPAAQTDSLCRERQHLWSCHEVYLSCPKHHPTALAQGTGCLELCFKYKELQERWLSANSSFGRKTFSKIGPECYFSWKEHIISWAFVFCILCRFPFSPCKVSMFLFHWCKYPLKALIELALMSTLMSCWKFRAAFEMLTKMSVTLFHKL